MRAVSAETLIDTNTSKFIMHFCYSNHVFITRSNFFVFLGGQLGLSGLLYKFCPSVSGKDETLQYTIFFGG